MFDTKIKKPPRGLAASTPISRAALPVAEQGIDDLSVVMEAGIAALLAVHARGVDSRAAALSLWQEYQSARAGLLALVPQGEGLRRTF